MCIILDVNCFGDLTNHNNKDMEPVRKWLEKKNSKIVIADTDKFKQEWGGKKRKQFEDRKLLKEWFFARKLKKEENSKEVQAETDRLKGTIQSNDEHIIALAKVSGVNVLVSHDKKLHKDFKKLIKGGKVYQKANHKRLLRNDLCP